MNLSTLKFDKLREMGNGSECIVYNLGDGTCFKKYDPETFVEAVYENAQKAYEASIGPEVYGWNNEGYRTEIVEKLSDDCEECDICDCSIRIDSVCWEEYLELKEEVVELFGEKASVDLHIYNIGLKNGKMIMIDFGESSRLSE